MSSRGGTPVHAAWHGPADEDGYSERDLGEYARGAPHFAHASASHGRYSLPPLGYGAHAASPAPQRATSLEVGSVYGSEPYAPPASHYSRSSAGHAPWAGAAPMYHAPSPPPWQSPEQAYWYAGAAPSVASRSSGAYARAPPLSPPPLGEFDAEDGGPAFFGVDAAHHQPGRRGGGDGHWEERARHPDDLPAFPPWSRSWYAGHLSADGHAYTTVPPPGSGWESETMTRSGASRAHAPYGHPYGRPGEAEFVKEERMRMLEKEFGAPRITHARDGDEEELDEGEEDELVLGSVDAKGRLITERPRVVLWLRIFLGLAAVAALACGVGGALLIKTVGPPPAAKGTIAAYVLYVASALTVVVLLYVYVLRPCCCDPRRKVAEGDATAGLGGLVIPVLSGGAGGKGGKPPKNFKGMKGMKGMKGGMGAGPTVNLVIDPTLLGRGGGGRDSESEDDEEHLPGGARRKRRKRRSPLGMLGNMQLQARWRVARATAKLQTTWDAVLLVLWIGAVVVALGMGKKCPAGSSGGWCDFYNAAIACGVLVAADLVVLLYFDYRDLRVSRTPPKVPL